MAQTITIKVILDTGDVKQGAENVRRQVKTAVDGAEREARAGGARIGSALAAGLIGAVSVTAITAGLATVGRAAIDAATQIDKARQTIAALTGSVGAANAKLAELRNLAQSSPGVTTTFATQLYSQFKAIGGIADTTIDNLIKSIGRLNAAFSLPDPDQFARNITQIFQQGFERADIKEALGQVPIFEQLLEEAFGTKDPDKLRKLKESGQLTLETFVGGIAGAVNNNPVFANIQESIGVQFDKARERVLIALAPIGDEILNLIVPAMKELAKAVETAAGTIASEMQNNREEIKALGEQAFLTAADISSSFSQIKTIIESTGVPIATLQGLLTGVAGTFALVRDAGELALAGILETIQSVALGILGLEQRILSFFGVSFKALDDDVEALSGRLGASLKRLDEGFRNFRALDARLNLQNSLAGAKPEERAAAALFFNDPTIAGPGDFGTAGGGRNRGGGVPGGSSGATGAASKAAQSKALRERKEFLDAINSLELERLKQAEEIAKKNRDIQLDTLKDQYDRSLISTDQFYAAKLAIQERNVQAELNLLQVEATQLEQARDAAKGAEKIKIEEKLTKIYGEQQLKVLGLTALLQQNFEEYKKVIGKLDPNLDLSRQEQVQGEFVTEQQRKARQALEEAAQAKIRFKQEDIDLSVREQQVQNLITLGVLSESEGRQALLAVQRESRDILIQSLETQRAVATDPQIVSGLTLQIEQLRTLGVELSSSQRFIKGLGSETETLGDIFERFGQNVSRAFGNIKDLFNGLKNAVKQFFADILGNSLRNLLRGTLGALFGQGAVGGGGFFGGLGGAVGGGLFGSSGTSAAGGGGGLLGGLFGGLFGGGGGGGGFLTGGFAGGNPAGSILSGGGVNLPILPNILGRTSPTAGGGFGGIIPSVLGGLGNLFKGFGFGLPAGSARGSLAASAPLLGLGLGSSLGGSSILGQILGGAGGALLGIGLTAAPASLGALGFLAPLFSNPITAIIGGALLPVAFLLGRAKQRKKDEEQSGVWLTDAIAGIQQIKAGVQGGSIDPNQARSIFENQVLATFIAQINTLKTKSVRESRLTNQVRDLRNLFDKDVGPAIDAAKKATVVNRNIIPEFHTGGLAQNETLAVLQKGELVLTATQQGKVNAILPGVFQAVGVPDAPNLTGAYHDGGKVNIGIGTGLKFDVTILMGKQDQTEVFVNGVQTEAGRKALTRSIGRSRIDREI